jgi:glutamyl-tRNA synthetase
LRTALFSYLWARRNGGKFLLRIEDTDLARNSQEAADAIVEAFKWVGLSHDGEIVYQSQRFDLYKKYIAKLLDEGNAYYCYMSREELDALRETQMANKQKPMYDNRWRDCDATPPAGVEPVVRLKTPMEGKVLIPDGVKGNVEFSWSEIDDFIIARSDGSPTYNLVVAIDDALMGVNHVIRGDDHLSNTPKQIAVYQALGMTIPKFFHVPMIHNEEGKKLSKRDGAMDVMEYKRSGYIPQALLNFLIRLGWSNKDQEIFSFEEMLALFDPDSINKSASAYNAEKLDWLNAHYIKNTSNETLAHMLNDFEVSIHGHDKKEILLDNTKERAKTLKDLADAVRFILDAPTEYNEKDLEKCVDENTADVMRRFVLMLEKSETMHLPVEYQDAIDVFLKTNDLKMQFVGKPLRLALFGVATGPNLADVLAVLGVEETKRRIENFLKII